MYVLKAILLSPVLSTDLMRDVHRPYHGYPHAVICVHLILIMDTLDLNQLCYSGIYCSQTPKGGSYPERVVHRYISSSVAWLLLHNLQIADYCGSRLFAYTKQKGDVMAELRHWLQCFCLQPLSLHSIFIEGKVQTSSVFLICF